MFRNVRFLPPAEFQHLGLEEKIGMSQSGEMAVALMGQRSSVKQQQQWKILHWVEIEQEDHRFGFGIRSALGVLWCPKAESAAHVSNQVFLPKHLPWSSSFVETFDLVQLCQENWRKLHIQFRDFCFSCFFCWETRLMLTFWMHFDDSSMILSSFAQIW